MAYTPPDGYTSAISSDTRELDVYIAIGSKIDQTSADDISSIEGDFLPMSNTAHVVDASYVMTEWEATFEADGIETAVSAGMIAPPITAVKSPPEIGIWSSAISDADGTMDETITINLSASHTSAFTVYTYGMSITAGTVSYYLDGSLVSSYNLVCSSDKATDVNGATYDKIVVHVTQIGAPYTHLKIVEFEFGSSTSYSKTSLTDKVTLIQEWDPTMQSIPLWELDFSLINVDGSLDPDNSNGMFASIAQDYPLEYAITAREGDSQYTIPCGRFVIAERSATETSLDIVAYDARSALKNNSGGLSLSTSQSFGDLMAGLFDDIHVPFQIEDALYETFPDQDIAFSGDQYTLLDIFLFIEQYYDIWLVPKRTGFITAQTGPPSGDFGLVNPDMVISFPKPYSFTAYNYVQVMWGENLSNAYNLDLRTDSAQAKSMIAISNPLVQTKAKATEIAKRVLSYTYSAEVATTWRGDPTMDVCDTAQIQGKWTSGSPLTYKTVYIELTYDGGLESEIRGVS